MGVQEADLRSTIEGAFDAAEQEGRPAADTTEPVRTPGEEGQPATTEPKPATAPDEDRGDGRRADGKFARKAPAAPAEGTAPAPAPIAAVPASDPYGRPPASWKPGAREAWNTISPEVRAEVHRRERETQQVVQDSAHARQVYQHLEHMQQAYGPALQAEGVDVLQASEHLMQLASKLRFGTQVEKAQLAAQIIMSYGVDIAALDAVLSNSPVPQQQAFTDPRVDQLLLQLSQAQETRKEAVLTKAVGEVEAFGAAEGSEFFEDVRETMADLMEVGAKRGIDLTLPQAYERACLMHPEIGPIMAARKAAGAAGNSQQSTQRAKDAASSVRGTPSGVSTSKPDDLRSAIEDAIEQVGGR